MPVSSRGSRAKHSRRQRSRVGPAASRHSFGLARTGLVMVVVVLGSIAGVAVVANRSSHRADAPSSAVANRDGSVPRGSPRNNLGGRRPGTASSPGLTRNRYAGPPYTVAETTLPLVDNSRIAVVDGHVGPRQLPTMVWYPTGLASGDERPLVVFASGYLQCPEQYEPLLTSWAAQGFVVAAPTFPLTNCAVPGGAEEGDILNQPADMSFVISQLLAASATSDPGAGSLTGRIDPHRVAVAGQSDGGDTVAALAFDTCCMGTPVQAAMILSGAELPSFGGDYFPAGSPPMLVVQGTADTVNVPEDSLALYDNDTAGPKALVLLDGADHLGPYEGANPTEAVVAQVTTDFLNEYLLDKPGASTALALEGSRPGVDSFSASPGP